MPEKHVDYPSASREIPGPGLSESEAGDFFVPFVNVSLRDAVYSDIQDAHPFFTVIKNHLKTAIRSFKRHKAYSSINVLGLAIGLACSFFILLWVRDELSVDRFNEHGDQIYRVMRTADHGKRVRSARRTLSQPSLSTSWMRSIPRLHTHCCSVGQRAYPLRAET